MLQPKNAALLERCAQYVLTSRVILDFAANQIHVEGKADPIQAKVPPEGRRS
jgi:hypothetical protein